MYPSPAPPWTHHPSQPDPTPPAPPRSPAAAAAAVASAAAAAAANAAYWARDDGSSCWTRLANALCDAIDAELETVK